MKVKQSLAADIIRAITKNQRKKQVLAHIQDSPFKSLLDIGSNDGYLLDSFYNLETHGVDLKYGQNIENGLDYKNEQFDYITMLAVIEHLHDHKKALQECHRILKKDGLLLLTTPKRIADILIKFYMGETGHQKYFNRNDFINIKGYRLIAYNTFEFGLNQKIILQKK